MLYKENIIVLHKGENGTEESSYSASARFVKVSKYYSGGVECHDNAVFRIPSDVPLDISKGDRVKYRDTEMYIYSVSENLKGTVKHIKLLCR